MLKQNLALNITTCLTVNPFSFDELITGTRSIFEREGILGFLRVLIALVNSIHAPTLLDKNGDRYSAGKFKAGETHARDQSTDKEVCL